MTRSFERSASLLERALKTIPLGSQTFSKSHVQFPLGVSPHFLERGRGGRVWDVDGGEYTDLVMGLLAVSLGYADPDVDEAVRAQLENGVSFTLAHPLEMEVAERIVERVPSAEMVRFGKNGSDATSAAVRVARAATGRDHVAMCGYHGWHDWTIGTTSRHAGIPEATRALTHTFAYDDAASLERVLAQAPGGCAAVILEPMNVRRPSPEFLPEVRALCDAHGALLVFDETITGFRFARGGAQELFGVAPDLSTFGKGLANGLPLSVLTGRRDLMQRLSEVFVSSTFGGETLSLAAARCVLDKLDRDDVLPQLAAKGTWFEGEVAARIERHGAGEFLESTGHPSWTFLLFKDVEPYSSWHLKTLFLQEVLARGVLTLGTHNLCHAHTRADLEGVLATYDEVFPLLVDAVAARDVEARLRCEPLRPVFQVRSS